MATLLEKVKAIHFGAFGDDELLQMYHRAQIAESYLLWLKIITAPILCHRLPSKPVTCCRPFYDSRDGSTGAFLPTCDGGQQVWDRSICLGRRIGRCEHEFW